MALEQVLEGNVSPESYDPAGPLFDTAMAQLSVGVLVQLWLSTSAGLMADGKAAVTPLLYFGQDLPMNTVHSLIILNSPKLFTCQKR